MMYSLQTGHYVAYVKHGEEWWRLNDHQVSKVTMDDVDDGDEEQPYLLFFKRSRDCESLHVFW